MTFYLNTCRVSRIIETIGNERHQAFSYRFFYIIVGLKNIYFKNILYYNGINGILSTYFSAT